MGRAVAALFALASFATAVHAEGESGRAAARAHLDFVVVVAPVVRARTLAQPDAFVVRDADAERGYVDVDSATTLSLTSNDPSGFQLDVRFDPRIVARIAVRMGDRTLDVSGPGRSVHVDSPRLVDAPVVIGYRIYLVPGIGPGTYPWPVRLRLGAGA